MAFDDLRSFLQALDDHGQLLKISEEMNAEPDLAAAANATGRIGDGAPILPGRRTPLIATRLTCSISCRCFV